MARLLDFIGGGTVASQHQSLAEHSTRLKKSNSAGLCGLKLRDSPFEGNKYKKGGNKYKVLCFHDAVFAGTCAGTRVPICQNDRDNKTTLFLFFCTRARATVVYMCAGAQGCLRSQVKARNPFLFSLLNVWRLRMCVCIPTGKGHLEDS